MSKRTRKLLFAISILALLCISYFFLIDKTDSSDNSETSSDGSVQTTKLVNIDSSKITCISFNDISLVRSGEKWLYSDDSDYPVDTGLVEALADTLSDLSYTESIKESEMDDLSVYGFDTTPENKISFTADGTEHTCYIGEYNSITGGYYVTYDDDGYIYMVNSDIASSFDYDSIYDLLVVDTLPEIDATYMTGMAIITPTTSYTYTPEIATDETDSENDSDSDSDNNSQTVVWSVQSTDIKSDVTGEKETVDTENFSTVVDNILDASPTKAVSYKPSEDELKIYGLSIPAYTIVISYVDDSRDTEEKTLTLSIGSSDDSENSYAIINDSQMIVTISDIDLQDILQNE